MYAIVATGGKQYKVTPGMLLDLEQIPGKAGDTVRLEQVLAVRTDPSGGTDSRFEFGRPFLKGAVVSAELVGHPKGPKLISFKYKRRKGYHRKVGHRQSLSRVKILEITFNGAH